MRLEKRHADLIYDGPPSLRGFSFSSFVSRTVDTIVDLPSAIAETIIDAPSAIVREGRRGARNISQVAEDTAEAVTDAPGNALDLVKEGIRDAGDTFQSAVIDPFKTLVGAEGLTFRQIASRLDLSGSVNFVVEGVLPWLEKVTVYADQIETLPLAQVRGAGRSQSGSLLNTLGLEIVAPPALPGQLGLLQSPIAQVVTVGVSFLPGFGTLISAGIQTLGAVGGAFGARETKKRQQELQARIVQINAVLQQQLNRSVQILGFLGDPDALEVLGVTPNLEPTLAGEKRPTRFSTVLPIVAAGGVALVAITALSGIRSRPAVLGRRYGGISGLSALDNSGNFGLAELDLLVLKTNQLEAANDRLVALLLEVEVIEQQAPASSGVGRLDLRKAALPALLGLASVALVGAALAKA